ncbi:MAG: hypothetical protein J3K34DRAFT_438958 [Monoraphidium minutum]|nr:MAG: hypothetical protein J3K34DRAFT_438958 [Monoraphidium minutum]
MQPPAALPLFDVSRSRVRATSARDCPAHAAAKTSHRASALLCLHGALTSTAPIRPLPDVCRGAGQPQPHARVGGGGGRAAVHARRARAPRARVPPRGLRHALWVRSRLPPAAAKPSLHAPSARAPCRPPTRQISRLRGLTPALNPIEAPHPEPPAHPALYHAQGALAARDRGRRADGGRQAVCRLPRGAARL